MQGNVAEDTRPETATRPTSSAARRQGAHAPQAEPGRGQGRQRSASPHPKAARSRLERTNGTPIKFSRNIGFEMHGMTAFMDKFTMFVH